MFGVPIFSAPNFLELNRLANNVASEIAATEFFHGQIFKPILEVDHRRIRLSDLRVVADAVA